uniref:Uncharacterized protein n=1 Tax=Romanomermis culicivorax TaxID=13658 RepID=A0A915J9B3_ROMCU
MITLKVMIKTDLYLFNQPVTGPQKNDDELTEISNLETTLPCPESIELEILQHTTDPDDKTEKERDQMIITQFYSKSSPVIQATMDKHKGQIVSLQDLVMFWDNLEKELKIQDELFEQQLQKHHRLIINEAKPPDQAIKSAHTLAPFLLYPYTMVQQHLLFKCRGRPGCMCSASGVSAQV